MSGFWGWLHDNPFESGFVIIAVTIIITRFFQKLFVMHYAYRSASRGLPAPDLEPEEEEEEEEDEDEEEEEQEDQEVRGPSVWDRLRRK